MFVNVGRWLSVLRRLCPPLEQNPLRQDDWQRRQRTRGSKVTLPDRGQFYSSRAMPS